MTFTIRQIAAVLGVTERAVQKRAKDEGWPSSLFQAGRGRAQSFELSALPRDIRDEVSKAEGPRLAPGEFVTIMEIAVAMCVTRQAVSKRALDEGWAYDPDMKPRRYAFASLPEDIRAVFTDTGSLDSGYAALKRTARRERHLEKKRRGSLGDEEFRLLLGRIKQVLGARSDAAVVRALGDTQSSMTMAKRKKQIPSSWLIQIVRDKGVSLDWLVFGRNSAGETHAEFRKSLHASEEQK